LNENNDLLVAGKNEAAYKKGSPEFPQFKIINYHMLNDEYFMRQALQEARTAFEKMKYPWER